VFPYQRIQPSQIAAYNSTYAAKSACHCISPGTQTEHASEIGELMWIESQSQQIHWSVRELRRKSADIERVRYLLSCL
jgi:hypothetical protein